jgi:alkylation response protein AidB-like acyl-CoA dehydrogenase
MDLSYTDEQEALRDSAEKFLRQKYTAAWRAAPGRAWSDLAALGWLGLPFASEYGGSDGGMVEVAILTEAMGRHLVAEPYISCVVLAGSLVEASAKGDQKARLLTEIAAGSLRLTVAHAEAGNPVAGRASTVARRAGGAGFTLDGRKIAVLDAGTAQAYLVTAFMDGGHIGVFHVEAGAAGLQIQTYATVDGREAAEMVFSNTPAERLGEADCARDLETALDRAVAAACSDMAGAMNAALSATVAYAKLRKQFGQPIGANQVVKHRLVEMAVRCEEARSAALLAAVRCSDGSAADLRSRAVSSAKVKIAKAARAVTEDAVQLHGAMGVTEELEIGGYLKRAIAFEATLGTVKQHRARYIALSG